MFSFQIRSRLPGVAAPKTASWQIAQCHVNLIDGVPLVYSVNANNVMLYIYNVEILLHDLTFHITGNVFHFCRLFSVWI